MERKVKGLEFHYAIKTHYAKAQDLYDKLSEKLPLLDNVLYLCRVNRGRAYTTKSTTYFNVYDINDYVIALNKDINTDPQYEDIKADDHECDFGCFAEDECKTPGTLLYRWIEHNCYYVTSGSGNDIVIEYLRNNDTIFTKEKCDEILLAFKNEVNQFYHSEYKKEASYDLDNEEWEDEDYAEELFRDFSAFHALDKFKHGLEFLLAFAKKEDFLVMPGSTNFSVVKNGMLSKDNVFDFLIINDYISEIKKEVARVFEELSDMLKTAFMEGKLSYDHYDSDYDALVEETKKRNTQLFKVEMKVNFTKELYQSIIVCGK